MESRTAEATKTLDSVSLHRGYILLKTTPTAATRLYDAAGNLTDDGNFTYTYSPRGRLKSATNKTTTVVTNYTYNGLEQRLSKQTGSNTASLIQYVYDEQGHLIGEYDTGGYPLQETVYLGDTPIVVLKQTRTGTAPSITVSTQTYFVYADHLNTPRVITQASNNLMVWRWDATDPFGVLQPNENPAGLGIFKYNLRFPGQVYDSETNLNYNVHRSYDSNTGSYTTSDPIGLKGGWNTYTYVGGNPVNAVDPLGLEWTITIPVPWFTPVPSYGGNSTGGSDWYSQGSSDRTRDRPYRSTGREVDRGRYTPVGMTGDDNQTQHGKDRQQDAREGDAHRDVGDANKVIRDGKKYKDTESGHTVYVDGDRVVIVDCNGKIHSRFKNSRKNTRKRIDDQKWVPFE